MIFQNEFQAFPYTMYSILNIESLIWIFLTQNLVFTISIYDMKMMLSTDKNNDRKLKLLFCQKSKFWKFSCCKRAKAHLLIIMDSSNEMLFPFSFFIFKNKSGRKESMSYLYINTPNNYWNLPKKRKKMPIILRTHWSFRI